MFHGMLRDNTSLRCSVDKTVLDQERLVHIFYGARVFADGGRKCVKPYRSSAEFDGDRFQDQPVHPVKAVPVYFQKVQGFPGNIGCDHTLIPHLRVIPDALQHPVGEPGSSAAAPGDLKGAARIDLYVQHLRGPQQDRLKFSFCIEIHVLNNTESVSERCCQKPGSGGCPDQREAGQVQTDGTRCGPFSDHDVNGKIFHGGIKDLLHLPVQPVDLVDEKDISRGQIVQDGRDLSRLFNCRAVVFPRPGGP